MSDNITNQPTSKKNVSCFTAFIVLLGVFLIMYFIIQSVNGSSTVSYHQTSYTVTLSVTGSTHRASVTYTNDNGGTEQVSSVKLPWTKTYTCTGRKYFSINAQNEYPEGTIVTTILVNNIPVKTAQSAGEYVVAQTSATIDE